MVIEYDDTQLSDDEIKAHLQKLERENRKPRKFVLSSNGFMQIYHDVFYDAWLADNPQPPDCKVDQLRDMREKRTQEQRQPAPVRMTDSQAERQRRKFEWKQQARDDEPERV